MGNSVLKLVLTRKVLLKIHTKPVLSMDTILYYGIQSQIATSNR